MLIKQCSVAFSRLADWYRQLITNLPLFITHRLKAIVCKLEAQPGLPAERNRPAICYMLFTFYSFSIMISLPPIIIAWWLSTYMCNVTPKLITETDFQFAWSNKFFQRFPGVSRCLCRFLFGDVIENSISTQSFQVQNLWIFYFHLTSFKCPQPPSASQQKSAVLWSNDSRNSKREHRTIRMRKDKTILELRRL